MNSEIMTYIVIICISGSLSILLGIYAYIKRRQFSSSKTFIGITCLSAIYIFGHAAELTGNTLEEINLWLKIQYFGLPFIAPCGLILILQYVGLDKYIHLKTVSTVLFIPFITLILSLTNDVHHLFYRSVYFRPGVDHPLVDIIPGPWYLVHGSYTFATLFLGICILLWYWKKSKWAYWRHIIPLLMGNLLPMTASFFYLLGISPMGMDPVPIVMCLTSALYIWGILSSHLFMLAPIARDRVFESMRDGVLVVDHYNRIVDYNTAAKKLFMKLDSTLIGNQVGTLLGQSMLNLNHFLEETEFHWRNEEGRLYRVHSTSIFKGEGNVAGKTIVLNDITEQKELENKLTELAFTDGLTKIYNRIYFMEKSSKLLQLSKDNKSPISLMIFDIDYFKKINDTYGHNVGDKAICHVVSICQNLLLPEYIFARFGGEEFVITLPNLTLEKAGELAEQIRRDIEATPLETEYGPIQITASFGVTEDTSSSSLDSVIHDADLALYGAKNHGRNVVYLSQKGSQPIPLMVTA